MKKLSDFDMTDPYIKLDFLPDGKYLAFIWQSGDDIDESDKDGLFTGKSDSIYPYPKDKEYRYFPVLFKICYGEYKDRLVYKFFRFGVSKECTGQNAKEQFKTMLWAVGWDMLHEFHITKENMRKISLIPLTITVTTKNGKNEIERFSRAEFPRDEERKILFEHVFHKIKEITNKLKEFENGEN